LSLHSITAKIGFSVGCGACQCAKCALGVYQVVTLFQIKEKVSIEAVL